jgi:hypothetical protein
MKKNFLLTILVSGVLLVSCSSSKQIASTVDDLYYSPTPAYVVEREKEEKKQEMEDRLEDNFLRNKVRNRNRWQWIDDYSYWNDTRFTHNYCFCNNTFTNWTTYYNGWVNPYTNIWFTNCGGSWNNPYYTFVPYIAPTVKPTSTWAGNVKSFNNNNYNNNNATYNPKFGNSNASSTTTSRPNNNGGFFNNAIRIFSGGSAPSSNAGGKSGGYNSSGSSSSSKPRTGRGN